MHGDSPADEESPARRATRKVRPWVQVQYKDRDKIRRASGRRRVRSHTQVFFPVPPSLPSPQRRLGRVPAGAELPLTSR